MTQLGGRNARGEEDLTAGDTCVAEVVTFGGPLLVASIVTDLRMGFFSVVLCWLREAGI